MADLMSESSRLRLLFRQAGTLLTGNAFAGVLGLLAFLLTARQLGAESFGALALVTTYALIVDKLINFQSWQTLIKFGAGQASEERPLGDLSRLTSFCLMADVASALLAGLVGFLFAELVGHLLGWSDAVLGSAGWFCIVVFFNVTGAATGLLRVAGHYQLLALHLVFANLFRLVGVAIGVGLGEGFEWFLWVYGVSMIVGYLIIAWGGVRVARTWRLTLVMPDRPSSKGYMSFLFWTNFSSVLTVPVKHFDVMLVGAVLSEAAAGQYKVIRQMGHLLGQISSPLYQAVYPFLSRDVTEGKVGASIRMAWKSGVCVTLVSLPIALLISVSSVWWIPLVLGDSFTPLVTALIVFSLLSAFSLGVGTIHPLFLALGFARETVLILVFTTPLYLWLLWVLAGGMGLLGVVLAFGAEFFVVALIKAWRIQRWNQKGAALG